VSSVVGESRQHRQHRHARTMVEWRGQGPGPWLGKGSFRLRARVAMSSRRMHRTPPRTLDGTTPRSRSRQARDRPTSRARISRGFALDMSRMRPRTTFASLGLAGLARDRRAQWSRNLRHGHSTFSGRADHGTITSGSPCHDPWTDGARGDGGPIAWWPPGRPVPGAAPVQPAGPRKATSASSRRVKSERRLPGGDSMTTKAA